jgi:signal transduction histidine kinase
VPAGVPQVAADRDKVRQVLVNLVENAIKYSPGGGRIEVGIEPAAEADADTVTFFVRDEGLGIPPDEQARIFEKFYRLDPNMTRGVGGTGLGLYICNELVNRMGGHIWVDSSEGKGSTFLLSLPTEPKGSARQPPRAARSSAESDR